ncbi:MAG: HAMP domain-containing histidine kinase, partial [Chitinophagaceae bacterium]
IYYKPVRILVTGYKEADEIIAAINKGNVFRFIQKPWEVADIRSAIEEGYKYYMLNSMLSSKNDELQRAYNTLDEFSYGITHGLRDPLLSVLGVVEISREMPHIPDDVREVLDMVSKAMLQLDNFIENTHDHHRIKRGIQSTNIWFEQLVNEFVSLYSAEAQRNKVRFVFNVQQREQFASDETLLKIILNNLLSNAFKYQKQDIDDKFVSLSIEVKDGKAFIAVKDNGIGISEDYKKNIFNAFYKTASTSAGSGLGLFNARDAVLKLGGEINVISEAGEGTTFNVIVISK